MATGGSAASSSRQEHTYSRERHIDMHCTATQMHNVSHKYRDRIRRCRVVRAEAVQVFLVTLIQCTGDGSGRSDSVSGV